MVTDHEGAPEVTGLTQKPKANKGTMYFAIPAQIRKKLALDGTEEIVMKTEGGKVIMEFIRGAS